MPLSARTLSLTLSILASIQVSDRLGIAKNQGDEEAKKAALLVVDGSITFDAVTFGYPGSTRLVLKEFTFDIRAKTSNALVGASGHGKSSLLALILQQYQPQGGRILLDGVNLNSLRRSFILSACNVVSQVPAIFACGTVCDNVMYGAVGPQNLEGVITACKAAGIHETILRLPNGYDTQVKEGYLSGGQRARLAIARAFLCPRAITLLDEPTAALDQESEAQVQRALDDLIASKRSTIIAVAHRLSTIERFDTIAAIYRGRVLEQGNHQELLAKNGYYAHLCKVSS